MKLARGQVAVITGGASGIGLGLARAFGSKGLSVVLADIEPGPLDAAVAELSAAGIDAAGVRCDVASAESVEALADESIERFGAVHVVCNNAGVVERHAAWGSLDDWRWVIDVDLWGVIHGVHSFIPKMLETGEPGHIINTASTAGFLGFPGIASYVAAKHAVVGLSSSLYHELADSAVGVSVLCPGVVDTRINASRRNRPGVDPASVDSKRSPARSGEALSPDEVATIVVDAVEGNRFWILPHAHYGEQALANAEGRIAGESPVLPVVNF